MLIHFLGLGQLLGRSPPVLNGKAHNDPEKMKKATIVLCTQDTKKKEIDVVK
jgi:hypothetical protein